MALGRSVGPGKFFRLSGPIMQSSVRMHFPSPLTGQCPGRGLVDGQSQHGRKGFLWPVGRTWAVKKPEQVLGASEGEIPVLRGLPLLPVWDWRSLTAVLPVRDWQCLSSALPVPDWPFLTALLPVRDWQCLSSALPVRDWRSLTALLPVPYWRSLTALLPVPYWRFFIPVRSGAWLTAARACIIRVSSEAAVRVPLDLAGQCLGGRYPCLP